MSSLLSISKPFWGGGGSEVLIDKGTLIERVRCTLLWPMRCAVSVCVSLVISRWCAVLRELIKGVILLPTRMSVV